MTCLAVIRGPAPVPLTGLDAAVTREVDTPWGEPSGEIMEFQCGPVRVLVLNRHGNGHRHTAHQVNYRANVWALRELGAQAVVATFTVRVTTRSPTRA